jgi:hypothetical protein
MIAAFIILGVFLLIIVVVLAIIAYCSFDDTDPDLFYYDAFEGCQQPYVALKEPCPHTGEKSIVTEWASLNCEKTYTYCLDCHQKIDEGKIDCR